LLSANDVQRDINSLRAAMKGFGTDEKVLIEILGKRTPAQMDQICHAYKSNFGRVNLYLIFFFLLFFC